MDKVLSLYRQLNQSGVRFYCWDMGDERAATVELQGRYGIFVDFDNIHSQAEELVTVAHEGGHCMTGATHKVSSPYDLIEQHEKKAWKWAVCHLISRKELDAAVADGYTDLWSLAEYFGVTESFMRKVVCLYTNGNLADELYFC